VTEWTEGILEKNEEQGSTGRDPRSCEGERARKGLSDGCQMLKTDARLLQNRRDGEDRHPCR
jgi:hypothetical protein